MSIEEYATIEGYDYKKDYKMLFSKKWQYVIENNSIIRDLAWSLIGLPAPKNCNTTIDEAATEIHRQLDKMISEC